MAPGTRRALLVLGGALVVLFWLFGTHAALIQVERQGGLP